MSNQENDYEKTLNAKLEFQNAVNTYYKLKSEYDKEKKELVRNISRKTHLSQKEKRKEFQKAKFKCINCHRPVGSSFNITFDKEKESRVAKAMCGDRINPCPLNIEINLGRMKNLAQELQKFDKEISDLKQRIVVIKNDIIFGYTNTEEAVVLFNEIKEDLMYATEAYETLLISYVEVYERPDIKKEIQTTELEIYSDVQKIKNMVADFDKENNVNYITDAITMYVAHLTPMLKKHRELKYPTNFIEHVNQQCVLNQSSFNVNNSQINMALVDEEVVSLVVGNAGPSKPKQTTPLTIQDTITSTNSREYVAE